MFQSTDVSSVPAQFAVGKSNWVHCFIAYLVIVIPAYRMQHERRSES